jgi:hypothetical protein
MTNVSIVAEVRPEHMKHHHKNNFKKLSAILRAIKTALCSRNI